MHVVYERTRVKERERREREREREERERERERERKRDRDIVRLAFGIWSTHVSRACEPRVWDNADESR